MASPLTPMGPNLHQSTIIDMIEDTTSFCDLTPIMQRMSDSIDLNELKRVLKDAVIQAKSSDAAKMYYSMMDIQGLLPIDILQHIESFNHATCNKSVSKRFKKCFESNENKQLKERESLIKTELNVTEDNKIWNINDGDIDTLKTAIQESNPGDTILINNGTFTLEDHNIFNHKQLQIIGNENAKIEFDNHDYLDENVDYWELCNSNLYFKNLQLSFLSDLQIFTNSSLWIENCGVTEGTIRVDGKANLLCVANSLFSAYAYGSIKVGSTWRDLQQKRHISISNCEFNDTITKRHASIIEVPGDEDFKLLLRIVGNCFKTVDGYPFGKIVHDGHGRYGSRYYINDKDASKNQDRIIRTNWVHFTQNRVLKYLG